ncbi:MAG: peptidase S8/S53 subtilisin kexin sedolisin, partial [Caldilineae bacterium]
MLRTLRTVVLAGALLVAFVLAASVVQAQEPVRDYILLGKNEKLPADLAQQVAARGGSIAYTVPEIGLAVLTSANPDFASQMEGLAAVESVIPDVDVNFYMPGFQPTALPTISPPWPDDDMFYAFQWNLDAIDAPEAWAQGATGAGVRIAVVDDGLFAQHPDIAPNLNAALSKSFVPGEPDPFTPLGFPSHSSHVAGIAAAADNGVGIIGVAPEAEIVGVRVVTW